MAALGDAVVSFPISGSYNPNVHFRVVQQIMSATYIQTAASTSGALVLPANPNRLGFIVINDSPSIAYFGYGFIPTSQMFSGIYPSLDKTNPNATVYAHEHHGNDCYTGNLYFTHVTATGSIKVTEFT